MKPKSKPRSSRPAKAAKPPAGPVPAPGAARNPWALHIQRAAGDDPRAIEADLLARGIVSNGVTLFCWTEGPFSQSKDITAIVEAVKATAGRARGDLADAETLLMAQAASLNALYTRLVERARVSDYINQFDCYMRLALRAQAQCRATLETLATIKNPPPVFARQANITSGPQQVNNGLAPAEIPASAPTKLLGAADARLDAGPTSPATTDDPALAPVGILDRPAHS